MLIHSSNMETSVFIHECQNHTKAPKGMQESRQFTPSLRCLLLILVTSLVLLVGGLFGFFTFGIAQDVFNSRSTCPEIPNQSNVTARRIVHFSTPDQENITKIFEVQKTGTYVIYVKVQKNESSREECIDVVLLDWEEQIESDGPKPKQEAKFEYNSGSYTAKIVPFVAQLHEKSNISLKINCGAKIYGDFYIEKIDDFI